MLLGDKSNNGYLDFDEFLKYVSDHERKLWLVFKSIDVDDNGKGQPEKNHIELFTRSSSLTVFFTLMIGSDQIFSSFLYRCNKYK